MVFHFDLGLISINVWNYIKNIIKFILYETIILFK